MPLKILTFCHLFICRMKNKVTREWPWERCLRQSQEAIKWPYGHNPPLWPSTRHGRSCENQQKGSPTGICNLWMERRKKMRKSVGDPNRQRRSEISSTSPQSSQRQPQVTWLEFTWVPCSTCKDFNCHFQTFKNFKF